MNNDGHGKVHGRFTIPELYGDLLRRALDGRAAPGQVRSSGEEWVVDKPTPERLGQALCDYIDDRPDGHGRGATSDSGQRFSPGELRRLAGTHGTFPAVMGSDSEVLDLGRRVRLATRTQRTALAVTQKDCQHQGCDIPARWCHVHYTVPWSTGGPTDLHNLQLLCPDTAAPHTAMTNHPRRT